MTREEFKYIYDQYFDAIRRYLYFRSGNEELASDIAQEAFIKIWEKQFDYENKKIKSLLYKISGDMFISHIRKEKVASEYLKEIKFSFNEDNTGDSLEYNELKQTYEKALAKLNEKQRTVFLMSRIEELKYKEIAERLDISVKAVEKRMSIALAELKIAMKA